MMWLRPISLVSRGLLPVTEQIRLSNAAIRFVEDRDGRGGVLRAPDLAVGDRARMLDPGGAGGVPHGAE